MEDIGNKILGEKPTAKNNLTFNVAKHLATKKINPTDTAILNFIEQLTTDELLDYCYHRKNNGHFS